VLLVSDPEGLEHLAREGVAADRIHFVGNVMIDTLMAAREAAAHSDVLERLGLEAGRYLLVTLHRPSNVDHPSQLESLLSAIEALEPELPCVFPIHPRTRNKLAQGGVELNSTRWHITEPLGYLEFLRLQGNARAVLTDSGGVQEETTVLGVPCITLRNNTERPVTILEGSNVLAGTEPTRIASAYHKALDKKGKARIPRLWDGQAAKRMVDVLEAVLRG